MYSIHIDTARTWRGGQNQVLLTVLALRSLGHRALLVAHPSGELRQRAMEGLDLLPLAPRLEMDFSAAWRLARVLRREEPAIVHAHDPHAVALAALSIAMARQPRPPKLVASRRVDFELRTHAFSRWKHSQVDRFVCASDFIRRLLVSQGIPPERVCTVHEGIDIGHVEAARPLDLHQTLWLPRGSPIVGAVGALVNHKGHRHLVDAAGLVVRDVSDARFVIVGEGPLKPALERQIRGLHLDKHVTLTGFRNDALSLLKGFDLFVMSSTTEGLGTSMLDAMACGKAVIGTDTGGIPEVVDHDRTGLLVPPRDAHALADAIVRLLQDPERRERYALAGGRRVREQFTVERMAAGTLAVYEDVCRTTAGAGSSPSGHAQTSGTGPSSRGGTGRSRT